MENFDYIEISITVLSIGISVCLVIYQLRKSRDLETIKYLYNVRKEIWDLTEHHSLNKLSRNRIEHIQPDTKRAIKQKLEYLATAVNEGVLEFRLIKKSCGKWFQSAARVLDIVEDEKEKSNGDSYEEIKKLCKKLDEYYNDN